jgi:hypothetical protein
MALLVGRSIPGRLLAAGLITVFSVSSALAQHARMAGGGAHLSPPVSHAPVSQPQFHTPASAMRFSAGAGGGGMNGFHPPRRPIRPFPPGFGLYAFPLSFSNPLAQLNTCWWTNCELFWLLSYNAEPGYTYVADSLAAAPEYEPSVYGEAGEDLPQLYLKDGTVLNVSDYWVVDGELHFTMIEQYGAKPVEHVIAFDALDVQNSIDANRQRGFRFVLRNEPVEQYVRDHPDEIPPEPVVPNP